MPKVPIDRTWQRYERAWAWHVELLCRMLEALADQERRLPIAAAYREAARAVRCYVPTDEEAVIPAEFRPLESARKRKER